MKKNYNLIGIIFLFLTMAALTSCKKKDDTPIVFPVKFYGEKIEVKSNIRMYTKNKIYYHTTIYKSI